MKENYLIVQLIKKNVSNRTESQEKFFRRRKSKMFFGKCLLIYSTLPLMSFWAVVPGMILS